MIRIALAAAGMTILVAPALAEGGKVEPGKALGNITLGATRAAVRKALGTPTKSYTTHGKRSADHWGSAATDVATDVVYEAGKVIQVKTTSSDLKTDGGLSAGSSLASVKQAYGPWKRTFYLFDKETGKGLDYYDDVKRGIAFVIWAPSGEGPEQQKAWAVVVHRPGHPAIPTEIKDLSNQATVKEHKGKK